MSADPLEDDDKPPAAIRDVLSFMRAVSQIYGHEWCYSAAARIAFDTAAQVKARGWSSPRARQGRNYLSDQPAPDVVADALALFARMPHERLT